MGRSLEPDFPHERLDRYIDSLVYTYRLSPLVAVMLTEQIRKLDAEIAGRRENVRLLRAAMAGLCLFSFPDYAAGDEPSYHMLTMNVDAAAAGLAKQTVYQALRAEGVGCFQYIPSPISTWPRLHWQTYDGPKVMWTEPLRQSGIDYRSVRVPHCEQKIARSLELGWNYTVPDAAGMQRLADAFAKVDAQLPALRDWERSQTP
jgi:dTDP-4-amino-4,6-dideoxygalactose transaminase